LECHNRVIGARFFPFFIVSNRHQPAKTKKPLPAKALRAKAFETLLGTEFFWGDGRKVADKISSPLPYQLD
jgi:hypothetical protein